MRIWGKNWGWLDKDIVIGNGRMDGEEEGQIDLTRNQDVVRELGLAGQIYWFNWRGGGDRLDEEPKEENVD